jgi:hypothetical protein
MIFSADSQDGHGQLCLLEELVVLRVPGKGGKLCEARSHPSGHSISGGEELSRGFIRLARIAGEVIPDAVEVNALPACHQALCIRSVEVEVPHAGVLQDLVPGLDAGNRSVHDNQPLDFVRVGCSIGVGDHVANIVRNHEGLVEAKCGDHGANVLGLRLLIVAAGRLTSTVFFLIRALLLFGCDACSSPPGFYSHSG